MDLSTLDEEMMRLAIAEAQSAQTAGEVPVGAIVVSPSGEILGRGQNRVLRDSDPTAHAEIVSLREAGRELSNYRILTPEGGCTLYVTLEPCAMCAGAIIHARISRLVYAAPDPKAGACGSVLSVLNHPSLNHKLELLPDLLAEECGALLTNFFRRRRLETSAARILGKEAPTHATQDIHAAKELSMPTTKSTKPPKKSAKKVTKKTAAKSAKKPAPKKWSAKVTSDSTHPEPGLFNQSAATIARSLASRQVSPKGPASGMRMLNFYINRAGENLPASRKAELLKAKRLLAKRITRQKSRVTKQKARITKTKKIIGKKKSAR